jgi:hypothetical protein
MRRQAIFGRTDMCSASGFYGDPRLGGESGATWGSPWSGEDELEYESESFIGHLVKSSPHLSKYALVRVIPDDPDYRKHVPMEYRLDAKEIVGGFVQDMQRDEPTLLQDLIEVGMKGVEEATGQPIGWMKKLLWASLVPLGIGYQGAAEVTAARAAAIGFSQGVVMGAEGRSWSLVRDYFGGRRYFDENAKVESKNYGAGLIAGYVQGRKLSQNQRAIFWRDLGHRMGDQPVPGPSANWGRNQWVDWYITVAGRFWQDHLVESTRGGLRVFVDAVRWLNKQ